ncbi:methyltransferase domain-containing protein [Streptomyces sp. NEAU-sy36]|uniref:class I SAM-dependent methyltransferase n=1 Tax=unclassified Streptomyces TaxID=2593676 RepID=UPI0015D5B42D|nr:MULTISPECIES: methyltransferase domain-containing protein [unclassified Streptomyces]QLJ01891.1 methyltransferase domain-containing protein [Streptomyces sp. NEAU-sy36]
MIQSAELAGVFDELADSYDHAHHEEIARALIDRVAPGADDAVADVACGAGAVALQLARERPASAKPVLAVDLSPGMVAVGRARAVGTASARAIDWRVGDAVPLPVPDHSLDVVFCASSLHFLGAGALADWRRALRPGGRVGFSLPLATHFRPSPRFAELLAGDVPLPADAREASEWTEARGFTGAASRVLVLGTRRVVLVSATRPDRG